MVIWAIETPRVLYSSTFSSYTPVLFVRTAPSQGKHLDMSFLFSRQSSSSAQLLFLFSSLLETSATVSGLTLFCFKASVAGWGCLDPTSASACGRMVFLLFGTITSWLLITLSVSRGRGLCIACLCKSFICASRREVEERANVKSCFVTFLRTHFSFLRRPWRVLTSSFTCRDSVTNLAVICLCSVRLFSRRHISFLCWSINLMSPDLCLLFLTFWVPSCCSSGDTDSSEVVDSSSEDALSTGTYEC